MTLTKAFEELLRNQRQGEHILPLFVNTLRGEDVFGPYQSMKSLHN